MATLRKACRGLLSDGYPNAAKRVLGVRTDQNAAYNVGDGGGGAAKFVDAVPEVMKNVSSQGLLSEESTVATMREAVETIARD